MIDACMARLYGKAFDRGGVIGRRGQVLKGVVDGVLRERYFSALPPKSCGREEFGSSFVDRFISMCRGAGGSDVDVVATATALTAESVVEGYRRFVWGHLGAAAPMAKTEFVVAGGGVKNVTLMGMLREGLEPLGVRVRMMEELGVEAQAKEAVAFCLVGVANLEWDGGECSSCYGSGARGAVGEGYARMMGEVRRRKRFASRMPTLATIKLSRRWGTRVCGLDEVHIIRKIGEG